MMKKTQNMKRRKSLRAARRKAIKTAGAIAATGVVINKWQSPVINSIVLPAHAQTTDATGSGSPQVPQTRTYWGYKLPTNPIDLDSSPLVTACVEETNGMATVTLQGDENIGRRQGTIPTNGTPGDAVVIDSLNVESCITPGTKQISISSISDASVKIAFREPGDTYGYDLTVFAGTCGSFEPINTCKKKVAKKKVQARNHSQRAKRNVVS